ncbi:MAG: serine/threonine-protein kinase [Calditrichaceae bacterium]
MIIDDRFEIIEPIRKTSGCIVYLALDRNQDINKALLMIPGFLQSDVEAMGILKEAARNLKWLKHTNIAVLYDLHTHGVYNYFEMEYVSGKSIKRKKQENKSKKFTEEAAQWIMLQVLYGLSYAHEKDLIHKNIKPQKIILTDSRQISLIDFGVTGAIRNAMALVRDTTSKSAILFMPPEQLRGKPLTFASDIYSLGATIYYLLESKPPFNHGDIHYQILNEPPSPINGISDEFNRTILKCLDKDMSQRYQTCDELINDIKSISAIEEESSDIAPTPDIEEEVVEECLYYSK